MTNEIPVAECMRCGRGFLLTSVYRDRLARRKIRVIRPFLCPTCFMKAGPLPKQRGKVKWFDPRKHYGFIVAEERREIFFHRRQVLEDDEKERYEGQTVKFHVRDTLKGPEALNVEMIGE